MASTEPSNEVQLSAQGRLVVPAHLRKALDWRHGERLIARRDGDSLILERRENVVRRLQARFAHVPMEVSLADELIAERRAAAKQEQAE